MSLITVKHKPGPIEVEDLVKVKATGQRGIVRLLEGAPVRKAYVDLTPGADSNYIYMRIVVETGVDKFGPETLALNVYDIDEIERIK